MKQSIWKNKTNNQLCVTIPKKSGFKVGDLVSIEKTKAKIIIYSSVASDFFHFGHLKLLRQANELGDIHITGVLTDNAISTYKKKPTTNLSERKAIISALNCVDIVMTQDSLDPSKNLKEIYENFKTPKIILVVGSNWKNVPGEEFIKKIGGKLIKFPFYDKFKEENDKNKIFIGEKRKIVYTAGTWDLFHIGHLNILKKSKKLGTKLIVGVSTDKLVKSYKENYPAIPYEHRISLIKNSKYVDKVVKQEKLLDIEELKKLKIDILTIGSDWKNKRLKGLEWAKKQPNIKVVFIDYTKDISSTKIKRDIKNGITKK